MEGTIKNYQMYYVYLKRTEVDNYIYVYALNINIFQIRI